MARKSRVQTIKRDSRQTDIKVLPAESKEDLKALADFLNNEYKPQGETETFLIKQMVQARWRLARMQRLEKEISESERAHFQSTFERSFASAERSYERALRALEQLRASRKADDKADWLRDVAVATPLLQ